MTKNNSWKEVEVQELFDVIRGNAKNVTKRKIEGDVALITATDKNNALYGFVTPLHNETIYENALTIHNNGNGVGLTFYHDYPFIATSDVTILIDKTKKIKKEMAEYIKTILQKQKEKYCYGYKLSNERLKKQKILLPMQKDGTIDYRFIEQYIKNSKQYIFHKYERYYKKIMKNLKVYCQDKNNCTTNQVNWQPILLSDLFEIKKGNQNNMAKLEKGKIPLVSAKKFDNGYKDFMSENGKGIFPANIITLNNDGDGGAGIAYYQPAAMLLDSHVTALIPKFDVANKYNLLFIAWTITKQREKFGHGYSLNNSRLKNFKFMLPISKDGNVDFEYMEKYVAKKISLIMAKYEEYMRNVVGTSIPYNYEKSRF